MDDLFLLGRVIFGGFFLYNGANHFLMNATLVQYAAAKGVPMPEVAVVVAGVLLLIGGFCVLTGIEPYVGLSCIALFIVCVTPVMHNFWTLTNPTIARTRWDTS
jgi:putative oxidoreductase